MRQQQNSNIVETLKDLEGLTWLLAMSAALLTRQDIGARLLRPIQIIFVAALILFASWFAPNDWDGKYLRIFALMILLGGFYQGIKRWWERRKGKKQHSYYIGTSNFDRRLPAFFKRNRIASRVLDPLLVCGLGYLVLYVSLSLGLWLIFSGIMLAYTEIAAYGRQREIVMDMVDGLVHSEYQSDVVEHYEEPPAKQHRQNASISTGLDDDIQEKIKRRKKK